MLTKYSLLRSAQTMLLALIGALALVSISASAARAAVTPDQAFGKNGVVKLQLDTPFEEYGWDNGTALADGSVAFVGSRGYPSGGNRRRVIRIIRSDGSIDRKMGPKYRIPFPGWTRPFRIDRSSPSVLSRQNDGKLLLAGRALIPRPRASRRCGCNMYVPAWYVMRLSKSGKRDRSFGRDGAAIVSLDAAARKRSQFVATGPRVLRIDQRGGLLLYGPGQGSLDGPRLVRLTRTGKSDRRFQPIAGIHNADVGLTGSGEIVMVRSLFVETSVEFPNGIAAEIRRYAPSGKIRVASKVPLPGVPYRGTCNGKCSGGPPYIRATVFATGSVLVVGGGAVFGDFGLAVAGGGAIVTMVRADGILDSSFGTAGHIVLPKPYALDGAIVAVSPRPNGEIWALLGPRYYGSVTQRRLVRLTSRGEIIPSADGSVGELLPGQLEEVALGNFALAGSGLLAHSSAGDLVSRELVVRRWNLEY